MAEVCFAVLLLAEDCSVRGWIALRWVDRRGWIGWIEFSSVGLVPGLVGLLRGFD